MVTDCERTVDKVVKKIPGKTNVEGLVFLCELANALDIDGWFVDLGTYEGRSAMVMLSGSFGNKMGRKVVSIDDYREGVDAKDPTTARPDFFTVKNRFKCRPRSHLVFGLTSDVPMLLQGEPVALVFVDADHTRPGLVADIETWAPLVVPGGVMAFDDYGSERWPDVKPTVDGMMADGWEKIGERGSVAAYRRLEIG